MAVVLRKLLRRVGPAALGTGVTYVPCESTYMRVNRVGAICPCPVYPWISVMSGTPRPSVLGANRGRP